MFFTIEDVTHPIEENDIEKLKQGDLVRYDGHISMVYSDRWGESEHGGDYDVVHAFGWECSTPSTLCTNYPWFRKVGMTANNHPGLPAPSGFGRIKLW